MQRKDMAVARERGHLREDARTSYSELHLMNKQVSAAVAAFADLPDDALIPVGAVAGVRSGGVSTIWREVKDGRFPAPIKVGRATRWKCGDVRLWLRTRGA